jgi:arylsulfatase A-like enzyme/tetratricopeptide (TPR) repeat protein
MRRIPCIGSIPVLAAILWLAGCGPAAPERAARLLQQGKQEEAARAVEGWTPRAKPEWGLLAQVYRGLPGFEDRAVEAFRPLAERGDADGVLLAARIAADADRPTVAVEWLENGVRRYPDVTELAIELSKTYGRLQRFDEAVAVLEPGSERDPRKLNLIGYALLLAGEQEKAEAYFRKSIEAAHSYGSDFAPPHHHLGLLHAMRGELEDALREQLQAIDVNRDHLEAHYQAMAVAERLGKEDMAARAGEGFRRLYRPRLERFDAFEDIYAERLTGPLDRGFTLEHRTIAEDAEFRRTFPEGSTVEFACLAPAGGPARFRVETGSGDPYVFDHEGDTDQAVWHPHRIELPGSSGDVELTFRILPAGFLSRTFGGEAPEGASFSEPAVLPADDGSTTERPNVVLISLDTLRADRVGVYGNSRAATPVIDRLAGEGVRFHRAEAPSNWTLPSHYSLFSGLTPAAHGVSPSLFDLPGYLDPSSRLAMRGSGKEVMLAEVLAEAGYRTAAVTESGWVSPRFGFDQGFRIYRAASTGSLPATLHATLSELEDAAGHEPWFLFVHTYATHQPYHAPLEFRTRWASAEHRGLAWPEARVPIAEYNRFHSRTFAPAPSDVTAFRDLYDGQVAWADTLVGEIVSRLERDGLLERTVVIVTSDHGEEIFERGRFDHGDTLFEEVTRVPLVLYAPGRIASGVVVDGPVSLIDLPGTILDVAGLGDTLGQGRSLKPLWEREAEESGRTVFAQAMGEHAEPVYAVWRGRHKLVLRETDEGTRSLCFDLESDPREMRPLRSIAPCERNGLRSLLDRHLLESESIREELGPVEGELDPGMLENLRNLGYIQ